MQNSICVLLANAIILNFFIVTSNSNCIFIVFLYHLSHHVRYNDLYFLTKTRVKETEKYFQNLKNYILDIF